MDATPKIVRTALLTALAALALALASGNDASANHVTDTTTRWAIDANPTGNTATSYGPIESCAMADAGADVTVDVIAEDIPVLNTQGTKVETDDTGGMIGFHIYLTYDASALSVTAADADFLLSWNPGSNLFTDGDELPDSDGGFLRDAFDVGVGPGATESGSGVIGRLALKVDMGAPAATYALNLLDAAHVDAQSLSFAAPIVYSALIAVGGPCPGPVLTGDVDCSGAVSSVDALKVLRYNAGLSVAQTEPCSDAGTQSPAVGDVDCSGAVTSVDALKILRFGAGLGYAKVHFCTNIGA